MSFKCPIAKKLVVNTPQIKVVVQTRPKTYTKWVMNEETRQAEEIEVSKGSEIVKELALSAEGAEIWEAWSETERASFLKSLR